ncbi:amidase [Mycolicibacterium mageritense DSM 44476 = CIP 104973]|uniref:amidase n=1 Tax=Mycolicibacterium mageritense TaxID=53462 RepID=A0ABN5YKJ3_MYCME|nr:amidase [Mycolicibacterium mageritense]MCC9182746.1 amidase [Mycolicibacterium mageritense]BBX38280.1 amidase [Mycolicibacterium mageritense]CDO26986.1 glutamyl-tRNA(Gln) amidotransferase subunit A [Mycolicibacterium mageritense DSM 44476 = CIP 104973]
MTEPTSLSVAEILAAFRDRSLSPVELLADVLARIDKLNHEHKAVAHLFDREALELAREAEHRYLTDPDGARPLEGIPVLVKEDEPVRGQPWTQGSTIYREVTATHTSSFVQRIVDAGAIVHGRSTAPEFSSAAFTQSLLWGVTPNPWNPAYSPGGSSGGSAVALATGMTILATGSDLAGSIRTPSSFCGTVGFKPPHGRVPVDPPFNLDRYCHCGPMARTVADCLALQQVIAGPDPSDLTSVIPSSVLPDGARTDPRSWRVAVAPGEQWPVDPEIATNTRAIGAALEALGTEIDYIELPFTRADVIRAAAIHYDSVFGKSITAEAAEHPEQITSYAKDFARWAAEIRGDASFLDGLAAEATLQGRVAPLFERYDAIILPTVATRGFRAGDDYVGHGIEVGGTTLDFYLEAIPAIAFNILSTCPALAVPSGFADNDVPTGVQIVTRPYDDRTAFEIGLQLDHVRLHSGKARP